MLLKHHNVIAILWLCLMSLVLSSFISRKELNSYLAVPAINTKVFFRRRKCSKYFVHDNVGDGFGHQLLDLASLMVYHLVNSEEMCYLGRLYDPDKDGQFGHGCKTCIELYNQINGAWPGLETASAGVPVEPVADLWRRVLNECEEPRSLKTHNPRCDRAREKVGNLFSEIAVKLARSRGLPQIEVALHVRKGDFPRKISTSYETVMDHHFPGAKIDVFTEFGDESNEILKQLNVSHELVLHEGGDALDSWLMMANAKILFLHQSSYSISASVGSRGIVFTQRQKPYRGRYDGNVFTCKTVGGWWISYGHGVTTCHDQKLNQVAGALLDRYD